MSASLAFTLKELEEAIAAARAVAAGNAGKVVSAFDDLSDLICTDLKTKVEDLKSVTKARRTELHFKIANHRDMRHAVAGSQFTLRMAKWNRSRDLYETVRALCPLELYEEE